MPSITNILNKNSFSGKRVWILASGPSLRGFNFNLIKNEITIGVNKAFIDFPIKYNISLDRTFLNLIYREKGLLEKWQASKAVKIFVKRRKREEFPKDVYYVEGKVGKKPFISLDIAQGIYCGNNSGFTAISFAIACGAQKIYLLGYDLTLGPNGETHCHSGYKHQNSIQLENKFHKFFIPFLKTASSMKEMGISIVNLNPQSALRCYPFSILRRTS